MTKTIAILLVSFATAIAAFSNSFTAITSKFSPAVALVWNGDAPQALVAKVDGLVMAKDKRAFVPQAEADLRAALRSNPMDARAVQLLATIKEKRQGTDQTRKGMALATRLSRREPRAQLWRAVDFAKAGKERETLAAYDFLMRTQPAAREATIPLLGQALANPRFRAAFASYIKQRPPWLKTFIDYNAVNGEGQSNLAKTLVLAAPLPAAILSESAATNMLTKLANQGATNDARALYKALPGSKDIALSSLQFGSGTSPFAFAPIGWQMLSGTDTQGFGYMEGQQVRFEGMAQPERSGTIVRKLLFLPSGNFTASVTANTQELRSGATAQMSLDCLDSAGKWNQRTSIDLRQGPNQLRFAIANDCPAQMLRFSISGSQSQNEASVAFSNPQLSATSPALSESNARLAS